MNIAFICYEAFLDGGIKVYTRELLNRIVSRGHRVVLFAPPPLREPSTGLVDDVLLVKVGVPAIPLLGSPVFGLRLPGAFRNAEREGGRFEIVHSNTYADALLPKFATKGVRITTVYHLGTTARRAMRIGAIKSVLHPSAEFGPAVALEGFCLRHADHLIAISEFTQRDILKKYPDISPKRVSVVYPGSNLQDSEPDFMDLQRLRRAWGLRENDRVLLYVGRLEERKGIRFLLKAFSLMNHPADAKLLLVGAGNPAMYHRLTRSLGIDDRVVFAGYVSTRDLGAAYSLASALVHSASVEGFGLTVADAVAAGLPVVATRVGSIPEIVRDGTDGYLVDLGDADAFADAITRILDGTFAAGRKVLEEPPSRFTWDRTALETLSLYERFLSDRHGLTRLSSMR